MLSSLSGRTARGSGAHLSRNSDTGRAAVFFLMAAAPGRAAPGAVGGAVSASSCLLRQTSCRRCHADNRSQQVPATRRRRLNKAHSCSHIWLPSMAGHSAQAASDLLACEQGPSSPLVQHHWKSCSPTVCTRPPLPAHERDLRRRDDAAVVIERPAALGRRCDLPWLLLHFALQVSLQHLRGHQPWTNTAANSSIRPKGCEQCTIRTGSSASGHEHCWVAAELQCPARSAAPCAPSALVPCWRCPSRRGACRRAWAPWLPPPVPPPPPPAALAAQHQDIALVNDHARCGGGTGTALGRSPAP